MSQDITIHLTDRAGKSHELNAPTDMQLNRMELCKVYEFPIAGTCGGMALGDSCQCYIKSKHRLHERSEDEEAMLSEAYNVQENSRLGCQIYLTRGLHGLCMTLAPKE